MLLSLDKPPEMCLGLVQHWKEGHGCAEAVEQEYVFFVTIILSFVSMIIFLREQRGTGVEARGAGMGAVTCLEGHGPVWRSMEGWTRRIGGRQSCFPTYTVVFSVSYLVGYQASWCC